MGAIAEAMVAYAQPLLDATDGSEQEVNNALAMSQLCYNLALLPEDKRDQMLIKMRHTLPMMNDEEFDKFKNLLVLPMIERHQEMFPRIHNRGSTNIPQNDPSPTSSSGERIRTLNPKTSPVTDRYAPCPCNSGRKYKFCCGNKGP